MKQYFKLDDKLSEKIATITMTDYSKDLELHDLVNIIEDLIYCYDTLEEQFSDYKDNCEENHVCKKENLYEEYGINESDFH